MTEQNKSIDPEFLFLALREIANRIERCGASPELTHAVSMTSDLMQAVGNKSNPGNSYALERVAAALVVNDESAACMIDEATHEQQQIDKIKEAVRTAIAALALVNTDDDTMSQEHLVMYALLELAAEYSQSWALFSEAGVEVGDLFFDAIGNYKERAQA